METVALTTQQLPTHTHPLLASSNTATLADPGNNVPAQSNAPNVYAYLEDTPTVSMAPTAVGPVGGNQPHTNFQRYLCVNFIISLSGIYPQQN